MSARAQAVAAGIRRRVLEYTLRNDGGYLSQACSAAELLAALYTGVMTLGESTAPVEPPPFTGVPGPTHSRLTGAGYNGPHAPELDRFVFSPVHYALVLYATLIEVGRLAPRVLEEHFNVDGSTVELIGAEHSPGHEVTAGSLAQALSQAAGIAFARRRRGDTGHTWVFMSDGEFQEGQTWEAVAASHFYNLDNLTAVVDANGQQCDGAMASVGLIEPLAARLEAFGAEAVEVHGHDVGAIRAACLAPRTGRPRFVIGRTNPCRGLDLLQARAPRLHYVRFTSPEERQAYARVLDAWRTK